MTGILNIDKPPGISSAAVVARVKRLLPRGTKIGHAGTLDPFATGVLLLLVGKATKSCELLMGQPKGYETTVKLGATTTTDDLESPEIVTANISAPPTRQTIERAISPFIGQILQRPPIFSAMKIGGRRAYDLARNCTPAVMQARPVRVDRIEIVAYDWPLLVLQIDCGRGTYIRSIARDLGEALAVGGYLTALRRMRVGPFTADAAVSLPILASDNVEAHLKPIPADNWRAVLHPAPPPYNARLLRKESRS